MLDMPRILWLAENIMSVRTALLPFAALLIASAPLSGTSIADRVLFGVPTEPVGLSNDSLIHISPPKWTDAAVQHSDTTQQITHKQRNFL